MAKTTTGTTIPRWGGSDEEVKKAAEISSMGSPLGKPDPWRQVLMPPDMNPDRLLGYNKNGRRSFYTESDVYRPINTHKTWRPGYSGSKADERRGATFTWAPEKVVDLKQRLAKAGLYGSERNSKLALSLGANWDESSQQAYRALLTFANQYGNNASEQLNLFMKQPFTSAESLGSGNPRAPLVLELTNPDDLRAIATEVSRRVLRRAPDDEFLTRFIQTYQEAQTKAQTEAYHKGESGGTVMAPSDPQVMAENQLTQENPDEAGGIKLLSSIQAFSDLIRTTSNA